MFKLRENDSCNFIGVIDSLDITANFGDIATYLNPVTKEWGTYIYSCNWEEIGENCPFTISQQSESKIAF